MKKYIIYTSIIGFLLAGCNPNKDIYENIKNNTPDYRTDFSITLSDADYATISDLAVDAAETDEEIAKAESIAENLYFSVRVPASNYVGAFLDQEYIAPDSTSTCKVTFNYSVNEYDSLSLFTLTPDDYTAIGGVVADSTAFTYNELPSEYLPAYLATLDQTGNYICYVTCSYWANDTTLIDTAMAYEYINDEWVVNTNVYTLTDQDYESMGSPGTYHNFSGSALPENYLPIFLGLKYPYESAGSKMFIVYKYYASGKTSILMDGWYYKGNNVWVNKLPKTEQFIHNGTQWLFDPTVHHTMVKGDYQIIVEYVAAHPDLNVYMDPMYNNTEYYYGASYYYENFDMRLYKRRDNDPFGLLTGLSDDEARAALTERLKEGIRIFLEIRFPDAQPVSNGIQVYYEVYYATYEPGDYFYKMRFKCTDVGQFEYAEGPTSLN